jgi:hypothetical protein
MLKSKSIGMFLYYLATKGEKPCVKSWNPAQSKNYVVHVGSISSLNRVCQKFSIVFVKNRS